MNVWVRSHSVDEGFYEDVGKRLAARAGHRITVYQNNGIKHDIAAESKEIQDFEGRGRRRGMTPISVFTPQHAAHLKRQYGDNWMQDKKAIAKAAENDASVARQERALRYAADAVRANSRG